MTQLEELLTYLHEVRGSDLHLKPGAVPHVRVDGQLKPTPFEVPAPGVVESLASTILDATRQNDLATTGEASSGFSVNGLGRFRVAIHRQRGSLAMVVRRVPPEIPELDELGLPPQVERFSAEEKGLLLVTGPPGSGKTTTVAAMLDRINRNRGCHILTIEDPIEVIHSDVQAIVTQREVGSDTAGYASGVRSALRQDADVIFVGEVIDADTARAVLTAAEVGHLVITTMRAASVADTINRLIDLFPIGEQAQARQSLVATLRGIVNQRLLERADGRGRTPAVEILTGTAKVIDTMADPMRAHELEQLIVDGQYHGMQTLQQALVDLVKDGMISLQDALAASTRPEDLRIALTSAGVSNAY
jgi:twitching motility protein PilT